ncbi:sugar ABC transporter substrate-binding protein [Micromonosporaceae bacterium Da 78-11]
MRNKMLAIVAAGLMATATMTACDDSSDSSDSGSSGGGSQSGKARVGVILPDTKSSQRWRTDDPKFLQAAFDAAGVPVEIKNAEGDKAQFQRIADDMINSGVKVLMIVNLDPDSARAVLQKARAEKIKTIDYDRLTLNGGADYYVSFDNVEVGKLQAYGLQKCLSERNVSNPIVAELNGSPTDNNATLFKQGYDTELLQRYDNAEYTKGPDQSVPEWDNDAGGVIFEQMLQQQPGIGGVLAANDGLAGAVIKVLKKKGMNGRVPVTGQDATIEGLQNILAGDQCVTVYKPIQPEAQTAANLAIQVFKGQKPTFTPKERIKDPESGAYVPFKSLTPRAIYANKIKDVVSDGFVKKEDLCTEAYAKACKKYGIK